VKNGAAAAVRISVIIPVWNDRAKLDRLLHALVRLEALHEIIVVDAAGDASTEEIVAAAGAVYLRARAPNRGAQMNLGAARAAGNALVFQHADTALTQAHLTAIGRVLGDPQVIGGAFHRKFDRRHPRLLWLEHIARYLSRHGGTLFGDQSVFVRREVFAKLGGFAPIPLMEDMEFSRRLRRSGPVAICDPPVESSGRRHLQRGAWRTSLQNGLFILLYRCGFSPHTLHRWYYRERAFAPNDAQASNLRPEPAEELSRG
jgi:rSAM/selenodomain-associated transferase 2